jgi:hypothetical protein
MRYVQGLGCLCVMTLLVGAGSVPARATARAASDLARSPVVVPSAAPIASIAHPDDRDEWIDIMIYTLEVGCIILDCYEIRSTDEALCIARVQFWIDTYNLRGVRPGLNPQQKAQARDQVEDIYWHTKLNPNVLTEAMEAEFLQVLKDIYADLGGSSTVLN